MKKSLMIIFAMVLISMGFVSAETFYVDDSAGNDVSGNGLINSPWKTIQYAIDHQSVGSGDTVHVNAGTYHESITINKPGITLEGTLGLNGERLSVIDPYVMISDGIVGNEDDWTYISNGIWTRTFNYPIYAMNVKIGAERYNMGRLCLDTDSPPISGGTYKNYCENTSNLNSNNFRTLDLPDELYGFPSADYGGNVMVNFFDAFESIFVCTKSNKCYVRFRSPTNIPNLNNKILYGSENSYSTVNIRASNVNIKNFDIKAILKGITIGGVWGIDETIANNVLIENNRITLGKIKIEIRGGETNAIIKNNIIDDFSYTNEFIGNYSRGSWDFDKNRAPYLYQVRWLHYTGEKFRFSPDGNTYVNTAIYILSENITVSGNIISNLHNGIVITKPNTNIKSNFLYNLSSGGIVFDLNPGINYINDNLFSDVFTGIRFMYWSGTIQDPGNNAEVYLYNNRFWVAVNQSTVGLGQFIRFHYTKCTSTCSVNNPGKIYMYHNSFSGGNAVLNAQSYEGWAPNYGMGRVYIYNNIISAEQSALAIPSYANCNNNWISGRSYSSCSGLNNVIAGAIMIPGWNTTELHNFIVPQEYQDSINSTFDISNLPWDSEVPYPDDPYKGYIHPIISCNDNDGDGFTNCNEDCNDNNPLIFPGQIESCANDFDDNCDGIICQKTDINSDGFSDIKDIRICMNNFITQNQYYINCSSLAEPVGSLDLNDVREIVSVI